MKTTRRRWNSAIAFELALSLIPLPSWDRDFEEYFLLPSSSLGEGLEVRASGASQSTRVVIHSIETGHNWDHLLTGNRDDTAFYSGD